MTQVPDTAPGPYYVSMVDGKRTALLLGPFSNHADALGLVDRAAVVADDVQPGCWFHQFGTVRMAPDYDRPGAINARFPEIRFDIRSKSDLSANSEQGRKNMDDDVNLDEGQETNVEQVTAEAPPAPAGKKAPTAEQKAAKNEAARNRRAARNAANVNAAEAAGGEDKVAKTATKRKSAKKAGKVAKPAAKKERKVSAKKGAKPATNGHKEPRGAKTLEIGRLLQRKSGCTTQDIKDATGWPAVSVPAMAKACSLKLRQEKVDGKDGVRSHTRYFGTPA